jgi:hypothetical protein
VRFQLRLGDKRAPAFLDPAQHALGEEVIHALPLAAQVGGGLRDAQVRRAGAEGVVSLALKQRDDAAGNPLDIVLRKSQPDPQLPVVLDSCVRAFYVFIPSPILADALRGAVQNVEAG